VKKLESFLLYPVETKLIFGIAKVAGNFDDPSGRRVLQFVRRQLGQDVGNPLPAASATRSHGARVENSNAILVKQSIN